MPDYSDPMVVLRYVILYQLGHINLAYTLIKDSNSGQKLTDTGRLQVVDFGAGTLAMSFGVALAVADALADGEDISTVLIESIDTGRPMMELGLKLWHEFINQVNRKDEMTHLAQAARLVQHYLHDDRHSVQNQRDWDCWLSALHTIYDDNEAPSDPSWIHCATPYQPRHNRADLLLRQIGHSKPGAAKPIQVGAGQRTTVAFWRFH